MDFLSRFGWLSLQAGYNALFLSPAAVLLPLAAIFFALSRKNWRADEQRPSIILLLVPSIGTILILLCGVIFHSEVLWTQTDQKFVSVAVISMNAALIIELCLATWVFLRLPKLKAVALLLGLLQVWYAVLCYGMAYMSVTNNWI